MKKNTLKFFAFGSLIAILLLTLFNERLFSDKDDYDYYGHEEYEEEYEESEEEIAYEMAIEKESLPKQFDFSNLSENELTNYNKWTKNLEATNYTFSSSEDFLNYSKQAKLNMSPVPSENYSYANGTLSGKWDQKYLHMTSTTNPGYTEGGFRTDGSLYDPENEEIYIVSFAGHIYKIDEDAPIKWSLRNQTKSFEGDKFNGVNLPDGSFRMLNQKTVGPMEYSDDEGRTWIDANGAFFEGASNYTTLVAKTGDSKRILAHGARRNASQNNAWFDYVYISTDYGLNYTTSSLNFRSNEFDVEIVKPHSNQSVYLLAKRNSDSRMFVYKMTENDDDFKLIHETSSSIAKLDALSSTTVNGTTHFYVSYDNTNIFYSGDEGASWTRITTDSNTGRNIIEVHPTKPNIVFKGFVELWISEDFGATWVRNNHFLTNREEYVWDLQHYKTYDKEDGGFFTISGYDFGTYYSTTPEDWNSWVSVSRGNPTIMCYDAVTSEKYNKIYTANQDRGSQSFIDNPDHDTSTPIPAAREANTDVLRVAIANGGESAWYWYYYGAIGRSSVTNGGNFRTVVLQRDLYAQWSATNMIPSPNPSEDAVYIPWEAQLHKLTFTGSAIERTLHPFTFPEATHSFGYSSKNKNRWYVGLQSGRFMYSTDGGNSFSNASYNGSWPASESNHRKRRSVIATSPIDEATVYYAGRGNSFLISVDGGKTFTNHNDGLDVDRISELEASPNGQFIFAACEFDGAWVYSVQQDKWFKMEGLDVPDAIGYTDVQFIDAENVIRFATYGSGILDFTLDNDFSTIFVASDNFQVKTTNETCTGKNGQLEISTKFNHNYKAQIAGIEYSFTNSLNVSSLDPGEYEICIGIDDTSYEHCINVNIEASELLLGKATSIGKNKMQFKIDSGTAPFKVFINDVQLFETNETSFVVNANEGDLIQVESKATCEGKLSKKMEGELRVKTFPNPSTDFVELTLPSVSKDYIDVSLYSITSKLVLKKKYPVRNNKIVMDLKDQSAGVYFVKVHLEESQTVKILKR